MSFASPVTRDGSGVPPTDPPDVAPTTADLLSLAERITSIRSARKEIRPSTLFGEPGWDMMLALYVASKKGQRLTITNVCDASDAPSTRNAMAPTPHGPLWLQRTTPDASVVPVTGWLVQ